MASIGVPSLGCVRADSSVLAARRSSALCGQFGRLSLATNRQTALAVPRSSVSVFAGKIGPGKSWEKLPLTKNGKPQRVKMHVRTGDTVIIIAGKDKGKVSEVTKVYSKTGAILVKGCNIKTVHKKPRAEGETGEIVQEEAPLHHSNVMLYSKSQQVRSRVGKKVTEDGKKVRYLVKTGEVIG
uniref:Large subunit ribosomal protein L24 n=1 Tax=Tetraselmis sp. GSL018 TaxID=582737 RepID=A0A061R8A6_9CHLO|eukprot:CAMPEP_0177598264 /NCGR_PEP_ID=MMETSP0419_2-20121207/12235_1 /TAXON_ID=582737 /ORGANISM="Tetraselmis sp., Strain GSL018" /LENGTH=182 /DNA_ID=CAMNT_0019090655 /DNA_START=94 /DNA_END=642 /DNA_ORIENTATION=+